MFSFTHVAAANKAAFVAAVCTCTKTNFLQKANSKLAWVNSFIAMDFVTGHSAPVPLPFALGLVSQEPGGWAPSECINNSNCNFSLNSFVSGLGTIVPHRLALASEDVQDYVFDDEEFDEEVRQGRLDDGVAALIVFA